MLTVQLRLKNAEMDRFNHESQAIAQAVVNGVKSDWARGTVLGLLLLSYVNDILTHTSIAAFCGT